MERRGKILEIFISCNPDPERANLICRACAKSPVFWRYYSDVKNHFPQNNATVERLESIRCMFYPISRVIVGRLIMIAGYLIASQVQARSTLVVFHGVGFILD